MLCFLCVLTLSTHYVNAILFNINTYYVNYICWLILLMTEIFLQKRMRVRRNHLTIAFVLMIDFLIGASVGEASLGSGMTELHTALIICIQYFIIFGIDPDFSISKKQICTVCKVILLFGVLASLYAIIRQRDNMIGVLQRNNTLINGWNYKSFFVHRNYFACCCYLASVAGCYLYYENKKSIYAICVGLLGLQIFITNSRASLISYLILVFMCLNFSVKRTPLLYFFMAVVGIIVVIYMGSSGIITGRLYHYTSAGTDSGTVRISMWTDCLEFLYKKAALISGMGIGTASTLLMPVYGLGSAHNAYIDALFSGGIIYLAVMLYTMWKSYKTICQKHDAVFKNVFRAGSISFFIYCLFESLASILTSNFFSVVVTILLLIIPKLYSGETSVVVKEKPVPINENRQSSERMYAHK